MIPKKWREDPLSGMLTLSAILLIILYGLEEWRRSVVTDAQLQLQTIQIPDPTCRLTTSGLRGETLVVTCPDKNDDESREVASSIQHSFEGVYVVSSTSRFPL